MRVPTWEEPEIYYLRTVNQANRNDWPKETQKTRLIKVMQTAQGRDSLLSLSASVSIHMYCTLFPSGKHFTYFTTYCLYVEIPSSLAAGPRRGQESSGWDSAL